MTQPLTITLKTLTPLWTGGIDGTCDRLHETGLIGSLRWWYEALVRGLGGYACDPTSEDTNERCQFDAKAYETARRHGKTIEECLEAGLHTVCPACFIFGCTGWRRQFRLEIVEDATQPIRTPTSNVRPAGRSRGWYLPAGRMGTATLQIWGDTVVLEMLGVLFLFIERWGNIGAKPQLGYGVVQIVNRDDILKQIKSESIDELYRKLIKKGNNTTKKLKNTPNLQRFGFLRYQFTPLTPNWWTKISGFERITMRVHQIVQAHSIIPIAPILKNEWRFSCWKGSTHNANDIFGTLHPTRKRSKIAVSWAYTIGSNQWEIRSWVWLSGNNWANDVWNLIADIQNWDRPLSLSGKLTAIRGRSLTGLQSIVEHIR